METSIKPKKDRMMGGGGGGWGKGGNNAYKNYMSQVENNTE